MGKKGSFKNYLMNIGLILYLFPPFGCIIVSFCEIIWVFYDILIGMYSFVSGTILLIDKNEELTAIKNFRKVIEFFGESLVCIM